MRTKTTTVTTDPVKFGATVTYQAEDKIKEYFHIGDEGETRGQVKRQAEHEVKCIMHELYRSRN